jgi:aspartate carbamoyltransferase catalytic subunit
VKAIKANLNSNKPSSNLVWSGRRHLLDTKDLSKDEVLYLINRAKYFKEQVFGHPSTESYSSLSSILAGKVAANLFYENSTRTRLSFDLASKRLGMHVLNLDIDRSSVQKGETIEDTARTVAAMGVNVIVQRHTEADSGAKIAAATKDKVHIVNAGEGITAHPTQGLLDLFTMLEISAASGKSDLVGTKLVIVGNVIHSRVARSIMWFAPLFNFKVQLVGPSEWLPTNEPMPDGVTADTDFDKAVHDADFVMTLRVQFERMTGNIWVDKENGPNFGRGAYKDLYQVNHERLKLAKPSVKVMHPAPFNRDVEISGAVADDHKFSVIETQIQNGVPIRMAVLEALCLTDE